MSDKLLAYTAPDGTEQAMIPDWGTRPVKSVTISFAPNVAHADIKRALRTLGQALNGSASVDFAETEDKFIHRLAKKAVPAKAKNLRLVTSEEWAALRAERDTPQSG